MDPGSVLCQWSGYESWFTQAGSCGVGMLRSSCHGGVDNNHWLLWTVWILVRSCGAGMGRVLVPGPAAQGHGHTDKDRRLGDAGVCVTRRRSPKAPKLRTQ